MDLMASLKHKNKMRSGRESPDKPRDVMFNRNSRSRRKLGHAAARHELAFHSPFSLGKRVSKNGFRNHLE